MVWPKSARKSSKTCAGSGAEPETKRRMAAPISRAASAGDVEQAHVDGGHAEEEGRAEIEELGGGLLMLEALQQAHAAAAGQPAVQAVAERVDVEQRAARAGSGRPRVICQQASRVMAFAAKLLCVRTAPLDAPVVPEV